MEIAIRRNKITAIITAVVAVLVIAHCLWLVAYFRINDPEIFDFSRLLDLDYEGNIPTLIAAVLFMINGVLFYLLGRSHLNKQKAGHYYWYGLAIIFVFLGVDEGTRLHEEIGDLFENLVSSTGALFFPWVIPYVTAFLIAVAIYFRFYLTLERKFQIQLFIAAVIFLAGAVGFEMLSATQAEELGTDSLNYSILYTIEESLEFAGLIFLLHCLLGQITKTEPKISLVFN